MTLAQPTLAPLSNHQIPESENESDSSGLDLPLGHQAQANLHWDHLQCHPKVQELRVQPLPHLGLHKV